MMMTVAFLLIQLCILAGWWRLLITTPRLSVSQRWLVAMVGYFAQIIGSGVALGLMHRLSPVNHLRANLLITLAIVFVAIRRHAYVQRSMRSRLPLGRGALRMLNIALLAALTAVTVMTVWRGAVCMWPGEDALVYHLPMVVSMMKQHHLRPAPTYMPIVATYPKSVQLYMLWVLGFFRQERWIDLAQLPFLPMGMLAVYCIARQLRTRRAAALAGALLLPFSPVVLMQLTTDYIDLAMSSLLLAAIALLLIYARHPRWGMWLMFAVASGALLGTKFSAVYWVAALLTAGLCMGRAISPVWRGVAAAVIIIALGGETYLQNIWEWSNPFAPYSIDMAGIIVLPGFWSPDQVSGLVELGREHPLTRLVASWANVGLVSHSGTFGGLGMMWPIALVMIGACTATAIRRRRWRVLAVIALFVLLFIVTPLNFRARFVLYVLGLLGLCAAYLLSITAHKTRAHRLVVAACLVMMALTLWQVAPKQFLPLFHSDAASLPTDPCVEVEVPHQEAYRWVRQNARSGDDVVFFRGPYLCYHYLLWNERYTNSVVIGWQRDSEGFNKAVALRPDAIFVLPRNAFVYEQYLAQADRFQTLFESPAVVIVRSTR